MQILDTSENTIAHDFVLEEISKELDDQVAKIELKSAIRRYENLSVP